MTLYKRSLLFQQRVITKQQCFKVAELSEER